MYLHTCHTRLYTPICYHSLHTHGETAYKVVLEVRMVPIQSYHIEEEIIFTKPLSYDFVGIQKNPTIINYSNYDAFSSDIL